MCLSVLVPFSAGDLHGSRYVGFAGKTDENHTRGFAAGEGKGAVSEKGGYSRGSLPVIYGIEEAYHQNIMDLVSVAVVSSATATAHEETADNRASAGDDEFC